jgi:hypothetical protein
MVTHMVRSVMFVAAASIGLLIAPAGSTPALAQSCQQKCNAQYPNAATDKQQTVAKARCMSACGGKK